MEVACTEISEGIGVVKLKPSEKGGKFLVHTESHGTDFVGDTVVIVGVSLDDTATIEVGDPTPVDKYIASDPDAGDFVVTGVADGFVDVVEDVTHVAVPNVQRFTELSPRPSDSSVHHPFDKLTTIAFGYIASLVPAPVDPPTSTHVAKALRETSVLS